MTTTRRYEVDWTDDEVERGGNPPPGWYTARVVDVDENYTNDSIKVCYEILAPEEFNGRKVYDTLWSPDGADDEDKAKKATHRQLMIAKRLGVLPPEDQRKGGAFEVEWAETLGHEAYLRLSERDNFLQVEYAGVYSMDDPRVPESVRNGQQTALSVKPLVIKNGKVVEPGSGRAARSAGGPPSAAATTAGAANGTHRAKTTATAVAKTPADDFSDL